MAINIGTQAVEAIRELKDSAHLARLVEGLGQVALKRLIASVASPVEQRVAQTSHAHGVWETYEAIEAAYRGVMPSQLTPPGLPATLGNRRGKVNEDAAA